MNSIKISAKTLEDAIIEAAIKLETSRDNVEYELIQASSSGFLGIGSKPAIIQAWIKEDRSLDFDEIMKEPLKEKEPKKELQKKSPKKQQKEQPHQPEKKQEKKIEKPIEKEKTAPVKENRPPADKDESQKAAKEFLEKILSAMGMKVEVNTSYDEDENLNINLVGEDMGILIGKRGQTLDSIQYLTSLVVNKGNNAYVRIKLDTENYRVRRKETLENLAKNIAFKVKRTRRPVFLEPMNPYERRIIHSALQGDPYVTTHSEGEEPYRKVVVTLKNK